MMTASERACAAEHAWERHDASRREMREAARDLKAAELGPHRDARKVAQAAYDAACAAYVTASKALETTL